MTRRFIRFRGNRITVRAQIEVHKSEGAFRENAVGGA